MTSFNCSVCKTIEHNMSLTKGLLSQWIHKGSHHFQYIPPVNHAEEKPHLSLWHILKSLGLNPGEQTEKLRAPAKEKNQECIFDSINVMHMKDLDHMKD